MRRHRVDTERPEAPAEASNRRRAPRAGCRSLRAGAAWRVQLTLSHFADDPTNEVALRFLGESASGLTERAPLPAIADAESAIPDGELDAEVELVMACENDGVSHPHALRVAWTFEEVVYKQRRTVGVVPFF